MNTTVFYLVKTSLANKFGLYFYIQFILVMVGATNQWCIIVA